MIQRQQCSLEKHRRSTRMMNIPKLMTRIGGEYNWAMNFWQCVMSYVWITKVRVYSRGWLHSHLPHAASVECWLTFVVSTHDLSWSFRIVSLVSILKCVLAHFGTENSSRNWVTNEICDQLEASRICGPYVMTSLCLIGHLYWGGMNAALSYGCTPEKKDIHEDDVGLCAQHILIILGLIISMIREV